MALIAETRGIQSGVIQLRQRQASNLPLRRAAGVNRPVPSILFQVTHSGISFRRSCLSLHQTLTKCGDMKSRLVGMLCLALVMLLSSDSGAAQSDAKSVNSDEIVIESMTTTLIRHVTISTRDSGVIKSLTVKPGDPVTEGQILGSLDDELQELAVKQAEPGLRIAQAKAKNNVPIETARVQIREAEEMLRQLESAAQVSQKQSESEIAIQVAEKARELAEFELNRAQKAKESFSGSVTKVELNRLQTQLDQRTLEVEKAKEDRVIAALKSGGDLAALAQQKELIARQKLQLQEREQEMVLAATDVEVAQAELDSANLQLQRRRLIAPFGGIVEEVSQQPGEWVERGVNVLRIIQLDTLRVEGFANAEVATKLQSGQAVTIRFNEKDVPEVDGVISFVGREVEAINQRVRIWAEFPNSDLRVRPGVVASMQVKTSP